MTLTVSVDLISADILACFVYKSDLGIENAKEICKYEISQSLEHIFGK